MSTVSQTSIRRAHECTGAYSVTKSGRGRHRVRVLTFTTHDGFVGHSPAWSHQDAYDAAVAERAKAQLIVLTHAPKPAPSAPLLHAIDDSTLFSEIERRGYVVVPAAEMGIAPNGDPIQ